MTYQEKQSIATLIGMTVAALSYGVYTYDKGYQTIASTDATSLAWALLVFVIFQVTTLIVAHIILAIAESIRRDLRKDPHAKDFDKLDEREKILDNKADRLAGNIYMGVVFVGVVLVALQYDIRALFIAIAVGGLISGYFSESVKLYLSRKGTA